jgi:hypothetical protein
MEILLWGVFLFVVFGSGVAIVIFSVKESRAAKLQPILGVVEPPYEPAWLVPLSPIEDEERAWELDAVRKDMEKNAQTA